MRIELLNPLPQVLAHYQQRFVEVIERTSNAAVLNRAVPSIEALNGSRRIQRLAAQARLRLGRHDRLSDVRILLWPPFGYLDSYMWLRRASPPTHFVVHDPSPLRKGMGHGLTARNFLTAWNANLHLIAHSQIAGDELADAGFANVQILPLPMSISLGRDMSERPTPSTSRIAPPRILVLGQAKAARSFAVLNYLGASLATMNPEMLIVGRGWPDVAGWRVQSRFLPEAEFDQLLLSADLLLLPYDRVYQSDVAVRAAELGVPVVGPLRSNLPDLFGSNWCGLVADVGNLASWDRAVRTTLRLTGPELADRVAEAAAECDSRWGSWLSKLGSQDT